MSLHRTCMALVHVASPIVDPCLQPHHTRPHTTTRQHTPSHVIVESIILEYTRTTRHTPHTNEERRDDARATFTSIPCHSIRASFVGHSADTHPPFIRPPTIQPIAQATHRVSTIEHARRHARGPLSAHSLVHPPQHPPRFILTMQLLPSSGRRKSNRIFALPLLFIVVCATLLSICSGQQIRIPLTRKDVPAGQHYRTVHAMAAHAANGFHGPVPQHTARQLYSDPAVPVALKNFYNRMYTGEVSIGTPAVQYQLVFDTGSADLWVFAAKSERPILDYVNYYDHTKSSTAKITSQPWDIQYGEGASKGTLVSDRCIFRSAINHAKKVLQYI
jgi:hypothetical protein